MQNCLTSNSYSLLQIGLSVLRCNDALLDFNSSSSACNHILYQRFELKYWNMIVRAKKPYVPDQRPVISHHKTAFLHVYLKVRVIYYNCFSPPATKKDCEACLCGYHHVILHLTPGDL